jgi:pimeloyl-ACP methyl ester carboxylesterase
MGGGSTIDVTLEHPDMVDALALVCSSPAGLKLDVQPPKEYALIEEAEKNGDWDRINELEMQLWFDGQGRTAQQVNATARAKALAMNRVALEHERKNLGSQKPPLQPPSVERLAEIKIPVLVVIGDCDTPHAQGAAEYMTAHISGARKAVMNNAAHLPNMEAPDVFNQILTDFLESVREV